MYKYYLMCSTGFILLNLSMVVCVRVHKYPPVLWKEKTNRMNKRLVLRLQFVEQIQKHRTLQQSMEKTYCVLLTDRYNWILSFIAAHMQVFLKQNLISKYDVSKRKVYIFQELKVHSLYISRSGNKMSASTYITNLFCILGYVTDLFWTST